MPTAHKSPAETPEATMNVRHPEALLKTGALQSAIIYELIGAPFKNCFTDPGRAEAGINRVLTEGKVTNYELTARARDGKLTVVSYNATTFHDRERNLQVRVPRQHVTRAEDAAQCHHWLLRGAQGRPDR